MSELVVITDSDLPDDGVMEEILTLAGFDVQREQCRSEEDIVALARDAAGLIVQWARVGESALRSLQRLRAISRLGIGVDMVDTDAATRWGVAVANTPDYCIEEVALHALALAFALLRGVVVQDAAVRTGRWEAAGGAPHARRPSSTTFGVLGFGRIGRLVVNGALGTGFRVIVHDIEPVWEEITAAGAESVGLEELLDRSDLLSLHVPLTPDTRGIIGNEALGRMKPGAHVVNTTRGQLIDEFALAAALEDGRLGGAALDVFATEPLSLDSPLRRAPGVILTPHSAWYSPDALRELPRRAAENLVGLLAGDHTVAVVNPCYAQHRRWGPLDTL